MILRNLWRRRTRSLLTTLGIAIGVAAVVALNAVALGINQNYGGVLGASNDLLVTQANAYDTMYSTLDEEMGPRLAALPGVAHVEPGVFTFVSTGDLQLFLVFGYEPNTISARHYRIVEGKPVTGPRQVAIGRRAADTLKKGLGQTIRLYGVPYRIVGIYETGQGLEESGGLVTLADGQSIAQKPRKVSMFQIGLRPHADAQETIAAIERLDKKLSASKASEYDGGQQWTGLLQGFATGVAGIAILIGGLGMMNAMVMSVMERTREIGALRAIGWSRGRVVRMIVSEALVLSLAGGAGGLLLGSWLAVLAGLIPGMGGFMAGAVTPSILAEGLITAVGLGLVGGAYPAWAAANLQPVEALRYEGGGAGRDTGRLSRVGPQSFRNLWRRRTRTLIAAAGIGVGVATLVMLDSMTKGLMGQLNSLAGSGGAGNITVMQRDTADMSLSSLDERIIAQIRAMPGVKAVSPLVLGFVSTKDMPIFITQGVDPASPAMSHYRLVEGRNIQRPDEALMGKAAAKNFKLAVGSTFTLYTTRYKVVGVYETGVAWEEGGAVTTLRESQRLLDRPRSVSFIFVDVKTPADADQVIAAINGRFKEARASLSSQFAQNTRDLQQTQAITDAIGLLALVVGGIVVANTMIMSVYERTREIGTLRALGWRKLSILNQIVQEGLWLCLLSGVVGSAAGAALMWLIVQIPGIDGLLSMTWDAGTYIKAIGLALVIGLAAGTYPAWRASKLQPVQALRYE
jgi:ABC-type antimicrobial peptide transport system permease subunit